MGLLEKMNASSGYCAENMVRTFNAVLSPLNQKPICSIAVAFKQKVSLLGSSVIYGSGFVAITESGALITHTLPYNQTAAYNFTMPKHLTLKNTLAKQKIMEGTFLNLSTQQYEKLVIQFAPKVASFPDQNDNFERFCAFCEQYKTK